MVFLRDKLQGSCRVNSPGLFSGPEVIAAFMRIVFSSFQLTAKPLLRQMRLANGKKVSEFREPQLATPECRSFFTHPYAPCVGMNFSGGVSHSFCGPRKAGARQVRAHTPRFRPHEKRLEELVEATPMVPL
jgi:hypothetical protein